MGEGRHEPWCDSQLGPEFEVRDGVVFMTITACLGCKPVRGCGRRAEVSGEESWTEWGVRFGDGDIDYDYLTRELAEQTIAEHRQSIASGEWDAADYEPMSAVSRRCTRVETHTDWTAAQPGDGGDAAAGEA